MTDNEKLKELKKVIEKLEDSINLNKSRTEWIAWDRVLADIEKIINNLRFEARLNELAKSDRIIKKGL